MALAALATAADLDARGVTVHFGEDAIVGTYLAVASAAVRDAAQVPISETTSVVTLEGQPGQWLRLPGPPVTEVATVELDGEAVTDWRLRSHQLWRRCGWQSVCGEPSEVVVTQTHGLPTVPADIVDLVCRLAAGALVAYRSQPGGEALTTTAGKRQESLSLGDYSYSVTYSGDGEMDLPEQLRRRLAARFGGGAAMVGSR